MMEHGGARREQDEVFSPELSLNEAQHRGAQAHYRNQ